MTLNQNNFISKDLIQTFLLDKIVLFKTYNQ